ncbi:unnamed protein product [Nesidiocoris tenuis]|uniref:Uncharacterized protein n=1 Tax=Nesidiocoris tenuis TaxID=355587 RepID=A0A6H5GRB6_9HEMI|nr:unnamed protein product [Nesidiocoris tenuis]
MDESKRSTSYRGKPIESNKCTNDPVGWAPRRQTGLQTSTGDPTFGERGRKNCIRKSSNIPQRESLHLRSSGSRAEKLQSEWTLNERDSLNTAMNAWAVGRTRGIDQPSATCRNRPTGRYEASRLFLAPRIGLVTPRRRFGARIFKSQRRRAYRNAGGRKSAIKRASRDWNSIQQVVGSERSRPTTLTLMYTSRRLIEVLKVRSAQKSHEKSPLRSIQHFEPLDCSFGMHSLETSRYGTVKISGIDLAKRMIK